MGPLVVYVFGTEDGREVKIGKTRQKVSSRKNQQENTNGNHEPLVFLAAVRATQTSDETTIHSRFKHYRSRRRSPEWFHAEPEVRDWIRGLQGQAWSARTLDDADRADDLPLVDSSYWLPAVTTLLDSQLAIELPHDPRDPWGDLRPDVMTEGDFYTHPDITAAARLAMGGIDLDPASCVAANTGVQARYFYGAKENGLMKEWHGNVWLNPPFGEWADWAPKAIHEIAVGHTKQLCALASSRSTTALSIQPIVQKADAVWLARGRYGFWGPNAGAPDEGHFVFYFGPDVAGFTRAYEPMGTIYKRAAS